MAGMSFRDKWVPWDELEAWREVWRGKGKKLVATNGCFDLLHLGHVTYLEEARSLGDGLLVGVNSDASVSAIKGPGRPVNRESDRALVLAALASVDGVCVFDDPEAFEFLRKSKPDVYVKGGDYTLETINQKERRLVESLGGVVKVVAGVVGKSTSELLKRMS